MLSIPLSLEQLVALVGGSSLSIWSGNLQFPMGNLGRVSFQYVTWNAWFYLRAKNYEMHMITVESVTAKVVFENGTTVSAELRDGFPEITLPVSADVNNDGKVSYTITFTAAASVRYDLTSRRSGEQRSGWSARGQTPMLSQWTHPQS